METLNGRHLGYLLMVGGAIVQISEAVAKASANASQDNVTFDQTTFGKIVAPIDSVLPISLGWALIVTGAIIVWVVPHLKG